MRLTIAFLLLAFGLQAQEFAPRVVRNMAELRALTPSAAKPMVEVLGYYQQGDGGGGVYTLTNTVANTNAYGGRVLTLKGTNSWELLTDGIVNALQFGAKGDSDSSFASENSARIQAAFNFNGALYIPRGQYRHNGGLNFNRNFALVYGDGPGLSWLRNVSNTCSIDIGGNLCILRDFRSGYLSFPTSADTNAFPMRLAVNQSLALSELRNLYLDRGYDGFYTAPGSYMFSCIADNITPVTYQRSALTLAGQGTQTVWRNVYTSNKTTNDTITVTSIAVSASTNVVFTTSSDFVATLVVGALLNVAGCDVAACNGNVSIVGISGNDITVAYQSAISPTPTTATLTNFGYRQSSGPVVYAYDSSIVFENLNLEWARPTDGIYAETAELLINGLHCEGLILDFGDALIQNVGSLITVNKMDYQNGVLLTNATAYVYRSTSGGKTIAGTFGMNDLYYNPGSSLSVGQMVATNDFVRVGAQRYRTSFRWNRSSLITDAGYRTEALADAGTGTLNVAGSTAAAVLTRTGNNVQRLVPSGGGISIIDDTLALTTLNTRSTSTTADQFVGGFQDAAIPRDSRLFGVSATGTDISGGNFQIIAGSGTGNSTTKGDVIFLTPDAGVSGTTLQSQTQKLRVKRQGQTRFVPRSSAPTVSVEDGDVYYDSTLNKLRVRASGAWVDLH